VKAPASADTGMPVRLALRAPGKDEVIRTAEPAAPAVPAAPVLASAEQIPFPVEAAPIAALMPIELAQADVPAVPAASAPDVSAMVDSLRAERIKPSGALPKLAELRRAAAKRFGTSKAVVQLGAYASEAGVKAGWSTIARRHRGLAAYVPASARFAGSRGTVYRLSLKGFASDGEARQLCMKLKASGSTCFVRNAAGDAPVRFASR
jgi:hypothetical protein